MKYLKSLLFSVFLVSGLNAIYAQTVIVKNITNNSTSDFIVFSGDYTLEDKLINTSPNDIDDFLKTIGNSITVSSGQTRPINEPILFSNAGDADKQLFFINNNTKTLKYEFFVGLSISNQLMTMLRDMQSQDDIQTWSTGTVKNINTLDLTIGDNLGQSRIEFR